MSRHERRPRSRSPSPSGSSSRSSDSSSERRERRRSKKRHKKDDKKKRHKKHKRKSDVRPSLTEARAVARQLLREFPSLLAELVALLEQLRGGGVAVIGGIANKRIRSQLKTLFPLLGLTKACARKLSEPKGAYALRSKSKRDDDASQLTELLTELAAELAVESGSGADDDAQEVNEPPATAADAAASPKRAERQAPIGPAMPPGFVPATAHSVDDDDDDDVIGPALPGMKGFRPADERVEAEMAQREAELRKSEWDRARGVSTTSDAASEKKAPLARQEWMTVMPESSFFQDSLAPANRPTGKPAAFRSKEPAAVDHTWFDAPEERDRARRAKLDIELLGYVREENAPTAASSASRAAAAAAAAGDGARGVNESIVPAANPEADDKMRLEMERLRQCRGPSLLEQHQQRLADEARRGGGGKSKGKGGWDRERDLETRRGMSNDEAARIIEASKGINAKFAAPTVSRQFL